MGASGFIPGNGSEGGTRGLAREGVGRRARVETVIKDSLGLGGRLGRCRDGRWNREPEISPRRLVCLCPGL